MFNKDSRYSELNTQYHADEDGYLHPYKARRFLPALPDRSATVSMPVEPKQLLDVIAFKVIGKPEFFWKIADANADIDITKLLDRPDKRLNIPVKKG